MRSAIPVATAVQPPYLRAWTIAEALPSLTRATDRAARTKGGSWSHHRQRCMASPGWPQRLHMGDGSAESRVQHRPQTIPGSPASSERAQLTQESGSRKSRAARPVVIARLRSMAGIPARLRRIPSRPSGGAGGIQTFLSERLAHGVHIRINPEPSAKGLNALLEQHDGTVCGGEPVLACLPNPAGFSRRIIQVDHERARGKFGYRNRKFVAGRNAKGRCVDHDSRAGYRALHGVGGPS